MLKRDIQIGQHPALRHQFQDLVNMRVRIHVVQANPGVVSSSEITELAHQFQHPGAHRSPVDKTGAIAHIDTVSRGVLRNDQQLTNARLQQCACFS